VYVWFNDEANPVQPGAFYTPPDPLPAGVAGEVLRSEKLTRDLPEHAEAWRVLYLSTDMNDRPIAVSGIVITPTEAVDTPRRILALAHGTQGIYPACATSQLPDALSHIDGLQTMIDQGFVVAITDYPGLGTPGVHPYLIGKSEAQAVLDSVRAAQNLVPDAGSEFAIIGVSQGGHSAMFSAQLVSTYAPELTLTGTVTQAGAFDLAGILQARMDDRVGGILLPFVFYGWASNYPDIDMDTAVVPEYQERVEQLAHTCTSTPLAYLKVRGIPVPAEFLAIDPLTTEPWMSILAENTPHSPVDTPLLLVHGTADSVIPFQGSVDEAAQRCANGEDVTFLQYPGVEHAAAKESFLTALGWIEDRFDGKPSTSNCANRPPPGLATAA
ncbi:MAG: alpha/beta fold hydrolase, partial [Thermomicrobiales bacterium]|nr:alpha/beta fold hydrolase [Thermomicrobiales bacterium]